MSVSNRTGLVVTVFGDYEHVKRTFDCAELPDKALREMASGFVQRVMRELSAGKTDTIEDRAKAIKAIDARWIAFREGKLETERGADASKSERAATLAAVTENVIVNAKMAEDPKGNRKEVIARYRALPDTRKAEIAKLFRKQILTSFRAVIANAKLPNAEF